MTRRIYVDAALVASALLIARSRVSAAMIHPAVARDLQLLVFISKPPVASPLVRSFLGE